MTWGLLSAVGIAALLAASHTLFNAVRLAGAAYMVVLGVRSIIAATRRHATDGPKGVLTPRRTANAYMTGLLTNLLNPKVGAFYITILPQFIPVGMPVLPMAAALAAIHATQTLLWLSFVAWLAARSRWLVIRPMQRRLEKMTGGVLILLGARLALERT